MEALEKTWQEVLSMEKDTYTLVDIRDELSFAYGNIPGSINLLEEALLAEADQWKDKTLVLYCKKGEHSLEVAGHLREAGWQEVYSLKGGYLGWLMQRMQTEDETSQPEITTFDIEQSLRKKFKKTIWSKFTKAVREYELVQEGDKIAVCISGGKDSMLMAKLFQELQRHHKVNFDLVFLVMDPGYSKENRAIIENNAKKLGISITVFGSDREIAMLSVCAYAQRASLPQGTGTGLQQDRSGTSL